MGKCTASTVESRATPHAGLAALGVKLRELDLLAPIRTLVRIPQKVVDYTPFEKVSDCFIGILAGAKGIQDVNRVLREDPALQAAFGREACAEQSTIQDTLDACTAAEVGGMEAAMTQIFRRHSQAYRHPFAREALLLDVDMTGNPCGPKAACATGGYFAGQKNRRGRQVGRVLATPYAEIVADRLFAGTIQLTGALQPMMRAAEETLGLTAEQRGQTIVRVDSGGGSVDDINWLLERGYQVLGKDYSPQRAKKLAESVTRWYPDPREVGREVGVVEAPAPYTHPVERIAVRYRKRNGQWGTEVLICSVAHPEIRRRVAWPQRVVNEGHARLLATTYLYDGRGGGCETSFKGDKQGLAMTKKNKKRFEAQQMVMQLVALAHNVLMWSRRWLLPAAPRLAKYGILRLVRDVMGILGRVEQDVSGRVCRIVLNESSRLAEHCLTAFQELVTSTGVVVVLGKP